MTGSFTYDPGAAIVSSNTSTGFDVIVREGASITLDTTARPKTFSGDAMIIDGRDQFFDNFSFFAADGPEFFSIDFRAVNTLFPATDFPTALALTDFLSAEFSVAFIDASSTNFPGAEAVFDITSLTVAGPAVAGRSARQLTEKH